MPSLNDAVEEYMSEGGLLQQDWPGYVVRPEQILLAREVEKGIASGISLALEAPTGTGKTLSYLLPALLSSRKVILSVGNLTLQDHLLLGEYQKLRSLLPDLRNLKVLKGCDNYFCHHRYHQAREGQLSSAAQNQIHQLWDVISNWLIQTRHGEIQTLPLSADQINQLVPAVTLGADQCLGLRCPFFDACYFQRARQQAAAADLLLINHTLLLSDQRLFEKGMGALLPTADTVIVDEAHQLPDLLIRRNTEAIEDYGLQRWIKRVRRQVKGYTTLFAGFPELLIRLERLWEQIRQQLLQSGAAEGVTVVSGNSFKPLQHVFEQALMVLSSIHAAAVNVSVEIGQLQQWIAMLKRAAEQQSVLYCDVEKGLLRVVAARLHNPFISLNSDAASWVFISATLAVDGGFDYFKRALSLPQVETHLHRSAMDYENRAMLWVPEHLPLPADERFYECWVDACVSVLQQLDGGMLMLFSSHEALQIAAGLIQDRTDREVLLYEPGSNRHSLLQQFRQRTHSVLLATGSFWEGIDVKGEALRCVAIDKLPELL